MALGAGWYYAVALLLGAAGGAKLVQPAAVGRAIAAARLPGGAALQRLPIGRIAGGCEVAVAAAALSFGNRATALLVAASYAVFTVVAWRLLTVRGSRPPCGCFGETPTPVSPLHVVVNVGALAAALVAVASPPGGVLYLARHQPWAGVPFAIATVTLTWLCYLAVTAVPALLDAASAVADPDPRAASR